MVISIASIFLPYYTRRWLLPDLQTITISCPEVQAFPDLSSSVKHITHSSMKPAHLQTVFVSNSFALHTCLLFCRYGKDPALSSRVLCVGCPWQGAGGWGPQGWALPWGGASHLQRTQPSHSWAQQWCWWHFCEEFLRQGKTPFSSIYACW